MSGPTIDARTGDWIQTFTGRQFWPMDPRAEDVWIADIAHALANICRFGGHSCAFYSVAEHSVRVSHAVPAEYALWGLLHDAAEAYIGDVVRPLKRQPEMSAYRDAEHAILRAVAERFALPWPVPEIVTAVDDAMLANEARFLMGDPEWARIRSQATEPASGHLFGPPTCCAPITARLEFESRFTALVQGGAV